MGYVLLITLLYMFVFPVLCREKELTAQIVEKVNNEYSVYLHNYKEDMTLSVNHQLVRQGLAAFAEGYAMDLQCELNSKIGGQSILHKNLY